MEVLVVTCLYSVCALHQVLIIPETLPAVGIDRANASALTRLRHEGSARPTHPVYGVDSLRGPTSTHGVAEG